MQEDYYREEYKKMDTRKYTNSYRIPTSINAYKCPTYEIISVESRYSRDKSELEQLEYRYMREMIREWLEQNSKRKVGENTPCFVVFEKYMKAYSKNEIFKRDKKRAYLMFLRYASIFLPLGQITIFMNDEKLRVGNFRDVKFTNKKGITECETIGLYNLRQTILHEREYEKKNKQ